jgi:hypothetical protein
VQALNAHNQMQLTPDELRFVSEYPRQVHKLLSLSIPDPAEHIGVLREQDLVTAVRSNGNGNGNGHVIEEGEGAHAPWTEVAPRRVTR